MSSNVPFEKKCESNLFIFCDLPFFTFSSHFILQTHILEWFIAHLRSYWPKDYITSFHIFSHLFTSCHILSHLVTSCHILSHFVTLFICEPHLWSRSRGAG